MCKFCDRLDAIIYFDKQEKELSREYTAAIVTRSWRKDQGKRCSSRSVSFRNQGIGFDLNFCPECGRKLKRQGKYSVKTDFEKEKTDGKA